MLFNMYVALRGVLRVFGVLSLILRDENESEVRETMCERGCLKARKVGISEQDMV